MKTPTPFIFPIGLVCQNIRFIGLSIATLEIEKRVDTVRITLIFLKSDPYYSQSKLNRLGGGSSNSTDSVSSNPSLKWFQVAEQIRVSQKIVDVKEFFMNVQ